MSVVGGGRESEVGHYMDGVLSDLFMMYEFHCSLIFGVLYLINRLLMKIKSLAIKSGRVKKRINYHRIAVTLSLKRPSSAYIHSRTVSSSTRCCTG